MSPLHIGTTDVKINYGVKTAAPTSPSPTEGSEYWHKTNNKKYIYNGSSWDKVTVTSPYTGGAATHWWKGEDLTGNDGWTAAKGNEDLTRGGTDNLEYNASDGNFNNKKSIGLTASNASYLGTDSSGSDNDFWNAKNEAFSVMIVTRKTYSSHSYGKGDALFNHVDTFSNHDDTWSLEPCGDHVWAGGNEIWSDDLAANMPGGAAGLPWKGIFLAKFDSSGGGGLYWWNAASSTSSWTTLGTSTAWPTSVNASSSPGFTLFMAAGSTATNHRYQGTVADMAYWKGTKISDTERDLYKDYAVEEYGLDA